MLWAYQRVFHGEPDEGEPQLQGLTFQEGMVMLPLLAIIFFTGIYPKPILDRIEPSVRQLVTHVDQHSTFESPQIKSPAVAAATDAGD